MRSWNPRSRRLASSLTPDTARSPSEQYQDLLAQHSDDWVLHRQFGALLEFTNDVHAATQQWIDVTQLLPHHAEAFFKAGTLLNRAKRWQQAEQTLRQPPYVASRVRTGTEQPRDFTLASETVRRVIRSVCPSPCVAAGFCRGVYELGSGVSSAETRKVRRRVSCGGTGRSGLPAGTPRAGRVLCGPATI